MIRKYFFNSTTVCILPNLVIKKQNQNVFFDVDIIENNFDIDKNSTFYFEKKGDQLTCMLQLYLQGQNDVP